jgi:hypothetical protein
VEIATRFKKHPDLDRKGQKHLPFRLWQKDCCGKCYLEQTGQGERQVDRLDRVDDDGALTWGEDLLDPFVAARSHVARGGADPFNGNCNSIVRIGEVCSVPSKHEEKIWVCGS